jgi:hypothetical protein
MVAVIKGWRSLVVCGDDVATMTRGSRALHPSDGGRSAPASAHPTSRDNRAAPAVLLLATALNDFRATMRDALPGLLDDLETEFLYDFRVAVRRTRSTLKLGRAVLPEVMQGRWQPAFKGLGDATTPLRDLDVYELELATMAVLAGVREPCRPGALRGASAGPTCCRAPHPGARAQVRTVLAAAQGMGAGAGQARRDGG